MGNEQTAENLLDARRRRLQSTVGRPLLIPKGTVDPPLSEKRRAYLFGEAKDLYWNDLEWELVTQEEEGEKGELPELIFPGLLAFVRGLLVTEVPKDSPVGPAPRPEVVEDVLEFLARRVLELQEGGSESPVDAERADEALAMTSAVLDRVLLEYHRLSPEDVGALEET